nr:MAG TPA: hypothetical protein [Caudoviricetes sp.]
MFHSYFVEYAFNNLVIYSQVLLLSIGVNSRLTFGTYLY